MALFIVSTPIGNLADITLRAIKILSSASLILSENTRTTARLLEAHGIKGKKILHFTDHTEETNFLPFLEIAKTQEVALVSEAGTPIIADPGYQIIKKGLEMGIKIIGIPGPSSLITAISISGLPFYNFAFLGFYEKSKIQNIEKLLKLEISVALFVPARDILKTLKTFEAQFSEYKFSIARELTKIFEDTKTGTLSDLIEHYQNPEKLKGEAVLMISGKPETKAKLEIEVELANIIKEKPFLKSLPINELSEILKSYEETMQNFSKKEIYNSVLKLLKK